MENFYLSAIVEELRPQIEGRTVRGVALVGAKVFIDLRLQSGCLLVASLDRSSPAFYLTAKMPGKNVADARPSHPFLLSLKKYFKGSRINHILKLPLDRIIRIDFVNFDASGKKSDGALVLALTGRSANAFLLNAAGESYAQLFEDGTSPPDRVLEQDLSSHAGALKGIDDSITRQEAVDEFFGEQTFFAPIFKTEFIARCRKQRPAAALQSLREDLIEKQPTPLVYSRLPLEEYGRSVSDSKKDLLLSHIELAQADGMTRHRFDSLSEAADVYYTTRDEALKISAEFNSIRQAIRLQIKKLETAMKAVEADSIRFDEPDRLKRYGDLILANLATLTVTDSKAKVIDYFDPAQPAIEIEIGDAKSPQKAASEYFARYQKARRAQSAIAERREEISKRLAPLKQILSELERNPKLEIITGLRQRFAEITGSQKRRSSKSDRRKQADATRKTGRWFLSSDGYEIAVGRNDRENDQLTFRVARSTDLWLHAGDYPGSHVVIRNPSRAEVPHRTIVEAAEIAAFYSQAKRESKAAVHYTQKKFVAKPPRSKPGLVRLSSYKTLMVEPRCRIEQIE